MANFSIGTALFQPHTTGRQSALGGGVCAQVHGSGTGETITMYEKCGLRLKAAEEAVKLRDAAAYARLLEAAGGRDTTEGKEIERVGGSTFKK